MNIKSQKDFFAGLLYAAVGGAFAIGATNYNIGTGARMGPGYFPLLLGVLLGLIGLYIMFKALVVETADGDKIGKWAWKPLFFIIAGNLLFGILLAGRHWRGWRGKTALSFTLIGFATLLLAYVGSRFVAEVILGRS